jgi:hypothetical protein
MLISPFFVLRPKSNCNVKNYIGATRPGGHIQTGYVARLSCAILYGMTSPGPPVQTGYVARLVVPIRVAQLVSRADWGGATGPGPPEPAEPVA